jgi:hypothetical protein
MDRPQLLVINTAPKMEYLQGLYYFTASQRTGELSGAAFTIGQPAHFLPQFFTAHAFRR